MVMFLHEAPLYVDQARVLQAQQDEKENSGDQEGSFDGPAECVGDAEADNETKPQAEDGGGERVGGGGGDGGGDGGGGGGGGGG